VHKKKPEQKKGKPSHKVDGKEERLSLRKGIQGGSETTRGTMRGGVSKEKETYRGLLECFLGRGGLASGGGGKTRGGTGVEE